MLNKYPKYLIGLLLLFLFLGCKDEETIIVNPILKDIITQAINSYSHYVSENKTVYEPEVYEVTFEKLNNICYITINSNYFYRSNLNGYIFINNSLVTFNNLSSECNTNWVKSARTINFDELIGFKDESKSFDDYSPAYWTFKVEGNRLIQDNQGRFKINFEINGNGSN